MSETNTGPDGAEDSQSNIELSFPVEFFVEGVPVSQQASSRSKDAWKLIVSATARGTIGGATWATEDPVFVTILYFPDGPMIGDIDNIVKPILDALTRLVYLNDRQVARVWVEKFEPQREVTFSE